MTTNTVTQANEGQPAAAGSAGAAGEVDPARAALRELVALSSQCAARENEIEQAHREALESAEKELARVRSNLEMRVKSVRDELQQKYAARVEQINQQFQQELAELKENSDGRRRHITAEFEKIQEDVNGRVQQAVWLAESMFEGAQNGLKEESKKAKEEHQKQLEALYELEQQADATVRTYRQEPPPADAFVSPRADAESRPDGSDAAAPATEAKPDAAYAAAKQDADVRLRQLANLGLPGLFKGVRPFLIGIVVCAVAGLISNWLAAGRPTDSSGVKSQPIDAKAIALGVGAALAVLGLLGFGLYVVAKNQVRRVYGPLKKAVADARAASQALVESLAEQRQAKRSRAVHKRDKEVAVIKHQFAPQLARATKNRDVALATIQTDYHHKLERIEVQRDKALAELGAWQRQNTESVDQKLDVEMSGSREKHDAAIRDAAQLLDRENTALRDRWNDGLINIQAPLEQQNKSGGPRLLKWDDPAWKAWTPPKAFNPKIRFGELRVDLKTVAQEHPRTLTLPPTFAVPASLSLPRNASLLIHFDRAGRQQAMATLQTVMVRLLTNLPAGRARFTLIDPVGLGQNFAGFMHLADHDEALVGGRIWTEAEHIDQRLADLTEHMETVIQKYLRNEFQTIDDYNAQAGELAEPYRFLVIADLPTNFSSETLRRLSAIASTGARCGVYTLITRDVRQPIPGGAHLEDIEAHSISLAQQPDGKFAWNDEVFRQFPLVLDAPPTEEFLTRLMAVVGQAAKQAKRVEVPFESIAPSAEKFWSGKSAADLAVPIGRAGATRLQQLRLGKGVAQHALIAGKTGSGKSTLLHALVTNLAMWYSPDEVEFYLVDFKKGVEFKTYASNELPHARAIAVESDREFGLSVLQRIDAELTRRGDLFRKAGVQDVAAYRQQSGAKMPRTLLIIDEFQEFFSEDDKLSQDAAVLLDRLVRQGRAFGIHVLLGSQTIGGSSGLSRSTIGQMAIRIALQTSEADSQLILGDNNSAARLLTRPGEAIYNDAGGLVEGNSPFQIAWLADEQRDQLLKRVRDAAKSNGSKHEPAIVFEGNAPADITKNRRLLAALNAKEPSGQPPKAHLGDPVAIKEATGVTFRRQAGANVLVVGQQEELSMAIAAASIVSLAAQSPAARFYVLDGSPADSPLAGVMPKVRDAVGSNRVTLVEYRATEEAIAELAAELQRRESGGGANPPPVFVIVYGLQRYRALRKSEDAGFSFGSADEEKKPQPDKQFADLLRDGPPAGMHVIAWCDTAAALERTLDRQAMREFDNRVLFQMSANDSSNLIDSPAGNRLGAHRALLYSEEQGVTEKFRPYALPGPRWLEYVKQHLAGEKKS
ncbi:MAG TPA: FtsK/SpoIIIE domain-containing protein [Tepidisphaeraceae bacterium]|nr:FtsK/SpoIIIE domain-containing protein [Tepidisphaeraceae bacterium]